MKVTKLTVHIHTDMELTELLKQVQSTKEQAKPESKIMGGAPMRVATSTKIKEENK